MPQQSEPRLRRLLLALGKRVPRAPFLMSVAQMYHACYAVGADVEGFLLDMKVTILGCGYSMGVPTVGCDCSVCSSDSAFNKRTRTSALIENGDVRILVDASPDLRAQALRHKLHVLDSVLFTHCHADHCAGIAELQAFNVGGGANCMPVYADYGTLSMLLASNAYFFVPGKPGAPWKKCHYLVAHPVRYHTEFFVGGCKIVSFKQIHGEVNSSGFLFDDDIAYCTDVKSFPQNSWDLLHNRRLLILGCLRYEEVAAHAHVDLCIEWIKELKPDTAVLTHMSHDLDYHQLTDYVKEKLPGGNVLVAYDGLELNL
ncbi:MBL fold metallo-hydrolase [Anaplasma marginale]|uniref:PhnP protein n=2 Tax=Anaplasma TaxID=768 RepID=B9KHT2_ANAMF|nr:MBL fold metallo-hydrolase [Anaplasma marginale]ACM49044.1 PhnP protein [Anaplasma marginale str. Florida]